MQRLFILSLISAILILQGCQLFPAHQPSIDTTISTEEQQTYRLLRLGELYNDLDKQQQQSLCKMLKLDYQEQADWQSAWLLVYSLNLDFSCLDQNKTLELLKEIQTKQGSNSPLNWLNNNQLLSLDRLKRLQSKKNRFYRKNLKLQKQLNETELQLQDVINKIQALKTIETNINKKLGAEFSDGK